MSAAVADILRIRRGDPALVRVEPGQVRIEIEAGAEATVVERHTHANEQASTEINVARGAILRHIVWQAVPVDAKHEHKVNARVAGVLQAHLLAFGGGFARVDFAAELEEHGELDAYGLMLGRGTQKQDNRTVITHAQPNSKSRQLWKSLLDDKATAIFDGLIRVRAGAMKTDASQQNKNLLLSKDAGVLSKPHLEIFADDVKCAHGSTTGQLSEDALFYLRARGIDEKTARGMLADGFAREILDSIAAESVRGEALAALSAWLLGGDRDGGVA